jgi:hemolysin activation/secretion protein
LSRGADDEGRTRISALRFSQEYSIRGNNDVFSARSQISWGIGAFDASVSEEPDSQFLSWQLQTQYARLLAPDTLLLLRGDLQLSDQELLADERFRLGGTGSVRGYRQDLLLGDNGLFASAEIRLPVVRIPNWETVLQIVPFFDVGKVWSSDGNNQDPSTLASLGLGLLLSGGENFSAGFYYGIPLVEIDDQGDSLQEEGISFFVEGQFRF